VAIGPSQSQARLGTAFGDSEEARRFVQQRIALFAAGCGLLSMGFYLVIGIFFIPAGARSYFLSPGRPEHLVGALIMLGVWAIGRRAPLLSAHGLAFLDGFGLVAPAWTWAAAMHSFGTVPGLPSGWLAASFAVIGRSIIIPSAPLRTAWVSALAVAPQPLVSWLVSQRPQALYPGQTPMVPPLGEVLSTVVEGTLWSTAAAIVAVFASRVIYGLRAEVEEARRLGQYTLVRKLGAGGMGEVYVARHALLRRPTAVKLLGGSGTSQRDLERFEREVQLTAELTHPNTVAVYDYGRTPEGVFYYAMEYLEGVDLEELVEKYGPQPPSRVIHLLRQACAALIEAHGIGLIHRDIKPANLVLCRRGGMSDVVKVLDFGLVKEVRGGDAALTADDVLTGTPHYMAPEAITSPQDVDARSDLYALGAVGYWLLSGHTLFEGKNIVEVCSHHLHSTPVPPSKRGERELPADLEALVLACLAKDPAERPADAAALHDRLGACAAAAAWTAAEARRWWDEHGEALVKRHVTEPSGTRPLTIGVDLAARKASDFRRKPAGATRKVLEPGAR
jgi:eukaryotic-like serine/threonine-protein kinase